MDKTWARLGVLVAILGAAAIGVRYGRMQGQATGPTPTAPKPASPTSVGPPPTVDDEQTFEVLPSGASATEVRCEPPGSICVSGADPSTIAAGAEVVAGQQAAPPPRLRRQGVAEASATKSDAPWIVRIEARLARPAVAGNAILTIADAADAAAGYITSMRQAKIAAGPTLAARLRLSPVDGVLPGRVYHLRVTQLINNSEQLLAQGDVKLE